jgi:hypothetical protein
MQGNGHFTAAQARKFKRLTPKDIRQNPKNALNNQIPKAIRKRRVESWQPTQFVSTAYCAHHRNEFIAHFSMPMHW